MKKTGWRQSIKSWWQSSIAPHPGWLDLQGWGKKNLKIIFLFFFISGTKTRESVHGMWANLLLRNTWSNATPSTTPVQNPARWWTFSQLWSPSPSPRVQIPDWCSCLARLLQFPGKFSPTPPSTWLPSSVATLGSRLGSPSCTSSCHWGWFGRSWWLGEKDNLVLKVYVG